MGSSEKVALAIPTLREAQCLPCVLDGARSVLASCGRPFEMLVVDDDSCDGTAEVVRCMAASDGRIRLLERRGERGLAGAILYGWQHTDASILAVMDADLQHPPDLLAGLVAAVEAGADLAIASRYAQGASSADPNPLRRVLSAAFTWMTRPLLPAGLRVRDPLSGFFAVRRRCVENILFRPTGFKLLLEILVRGRVSSVVEIPYAFGRRGGGRSKAGLRVAWDYLQLVMQLYRARFRAGRMADARAD